MITGKQVFRMTMARNRVILCLLQDFKPKSDGNLLYRFFNYSSIKHCLIRGANTDRIFFCQAKTKAQAIIGLLPSISAKHGGKRLSREIFHDSPKNI